MVMEIPVSSTYEHDDGIFCNSPCHAHLVVVDVDEDGMRIGGKNNNGSMVVEFEIVAANDPSQVGLRHRSYFTRSIDAAWVMLNFAIAAGIKTVDGQIVTADLIKALKDAGKSPVIDFEKDGPGCQLFGDIEWNEYNGKKGLKIQGRSFYHMTSRQCTNPTNWPRNDVFIKKAGIVMPTMNAAKPHGTPLNSVPSGATGSQSTSGPIGSAATNALSGIKF